MTKPAPVTDDPIFFHTSQIKIGTQLVYYGRLAPMTTWRVIDIHTTVRVGRGAYKQAPVKQVEHLKDQVTLAMFVNGRRTNTTRVVAFAYMSYSAIWRLP